MATDTDPTVDPFGNFYFSLLIDDVEIARFMECSGLKTTAEVFEIEEGGLNTHAHKRPGHSTWGDVTLKKGVHAGMAFEKWRDQYMRPTWEDDDGEKAGWGARPTTTAAIVVRDSDGVELRRYVLLQCWPLSWEGPSLNADGSALAVESLELAHEGILVDDSPRPQGPQGGRVEGGGENDGTDDSVAHFIIGAFGVDITQAESMGLEGLVVEDHVAMMDILRCSFHGQSEFDWSSVSLGDEAEAGFGGHGEMVFKGFVTALRHSLHSGKEMLEVIAMDPLCKLGASRHTRIFEEVKDSDIVNTVLGEASVDKGTIDTTSTTYKYVLQRNESDLDFLKRLAARNGYMLNGTFDGKVEFVKPQYSGSPIELERDDLLAFDYTVTPQEIPPEMTVFGWDYVAKEVVSGTATSSDVTGIGGGANGVAESGTIWQQSAYISDVLVTDQAAAKEMAIAELNRHARTFVRGRAVIEGRGDIRAGALITFKKHAAGFNPEAFVVGSKHTVSQGVYTTEFWFIGNTRPQ